MIFRFPMWYVSSLEILSLSGYLELVQLLRRSCHLHPWSLTWNLKITCLKRNVIFQTFIFGFHVNFQRCSKWWLRSPPLRSHEGNGHGYEWTDLWGTKTKPRCCWSQTNKHTLKSFYKPTRVPLQKNSGTPKWMVKIMEKHLLKWMIWGENPPF